MNKNLSDLQAKIQNLKSEKKKLSSPVHGYSIAVAMMTDLISCILVGLGVGLFLQKVFHTSVLITAGLTLLGGIAGLYTVIRFAMSKDKKAP